MKTKIIITSILTTLVMQVVASTSVIAVSNEIGTFKETVFVDVLRNSGNTENIIDSQSGNWGRITSNFKYGLRINLRRTGGGLYPFETGDIIDLSYVLVNSSYITAGGTAPSQPTCLNSSWIFTVVDCTIHMQNVSDIEYLTTMYNVDLTMLRNPTDDSSAIAGLIRQWSAGQPESYSNNINIYYFQYRLRYTGAGENRDNIILYGNFTNGQPWWLQFNETIPISSSLESGAIQAQEQQTQAGETAQQEANTQGGTAEQQIGTGSQSIINGASSIIGALTDTTAGDCTINLNMGNLDLGNQNFCQGDIGPLRPIIATITNILFAFVAFRVFAFLIGVMFGLFDEFFGTKTEKGGA